MPGTGYVYPLPAGEWETSRTDQGVDFINTSASSRILAIGNAKVLSTGAPGWPGGGGVLYQLLDGPARGKIIYVFENVAPKVRAGQRVRAGQVIATMKGTGYPWLEMGFANAAGEPTSHGEYTEGKETVAGKAMKRFLAQLKKGPNGGFQVPAGNLPAGGRKELRKLAGEENLGEGFFPNGQELVSTVGGEVISALENLLGEKAVPILLNIALVGGGAFLVYFGIARMVGVAQPVRTPAAKLRTAAVAGAAV
jgi:hypothetical protein